MHTDKENNGRKTHAGSGYPKEVRAEAPIGIIWKAATRALTVGGFRRKGRRKNKAKTERCHAATGAKPGMYIICVKS
jgi:hypothetical protein